MFSLRPRYISTNNPRGKHHRRSCSLAAVGKLDFARDIESNACARRPQHRAVNRERASTTHAHIDTTRIMRTHAQLLQLAHSGLLRK